MVRKRFTRPDGTVYSVTLEHHPGGLVYTRQAKEKHRCWRPAGWAYDRPGLEWAVRQGCNLLEIRTEAAVYRCPTSTLVEAIEVNFGAGPQILVPLEHWTITKKKCPPAGQQERFTQLAFEW
ncbi:MAG: hypothetical protein PWP72_802 [Thermoanaerobacter sp.]|jgi:hypothetical protein|nr:hypothetical protein [Thermoanaerobacter sp.]